jgi:Family of unknown function (DUF5670)
MWLIIAATLAICWLLGFILFPVAGAVIHVLILAAMAMVMFHLARGKRRTPKPFIHR